MAQLARQGNPEPLDQALRYCMLLVGIRQRNLPPPAETEVLCQFIESAYGGHTPQELRLAFQMAIAGDLGDVKVEAFENFSVEYVSRILNAYRKWVKDNQVEKYLPPPDIEYLERRRPTVVQINLEYAYVRQQEQARIIESRKPLKYFYEQQ